MTKKDVLLVITKKSRIRITKSITKKALTSASKASKSSREDSNWSLNNAVSLTSASIWSMISTLWMHALHWVEWEISKSVGRDQETDYA